MFSEKQIDFNALQEDSDVAALEAEIAQKAAEDAQEAAEAAQAAAEAVDRVRALQLMHYQDGCKLRDQAIESNDLLRGIEHFEQVNSFEGFYAIGEIYQHGISRVYNGTPVRINQNSELAVSYFLKSYETYNVAPAQESKEELTQSYRRLEVKVHGESESMHNLSESFDLNQLNTILGKAKLGHPEALFQLALFYDAELVNYQNGKSQISALPNQLQQWRNACLEASANLLHPHAAYKLIKCHSQQLTTDKKLKFSLIAADPNRFREVSLSSHREGSLLTYRGNLPLLPIHLDPPAGALPPELLVVETISGGKMGGIYENSVRVTNKKCLLPTAHVVTNKSVATQANLQSRDQISLAAMREMRAKQFAALSKKTITPAVSTTPVKKC